MFFYSSQKPVNDRRTLILSWNGRFYWFEIKMRMENENVLLFIKVEIRLFHLEITVCQCLNHVLTAPPSGASKSLLRLDRLLMMHLWILCFLWRDKYYPCLTSVSLFFPLYFEWKFSCLTQKIVLFSPTCVCTFT